MNTFIATIMISMLIAKTRKLIHTSMNIRAWNTSTDTCPISIIGMRISDKESVKMKELTLAEKIVELLKSKPGLSDRKITDELFGSGKPQQPVNNVCRQLEKAGILIRKKTGEYPIQNYLASQEVVVLSPQIEIAEGKIEEHFLEDAIKKILEGWLIAQGWKVKVAWAHDRGSDIEDRKSVV